MIFLLVALTPEWAAGALFLCNQNEANICDLSLHPQVD
jgi:hypothetical protein